jgi:alanine racemase
MPTEPLRGPVLTVDLDAVAENYRALRKAAEPAECAAVVKADAYGLGMVPIVRRLLREGCRRFFVATLAEAEALRAATPLAEVLVFEGVAPGTADALGALRAIPVLNTLEQIERWRSRGRACLHLDTGMTRLGLGAADVATLAAEPQRLEGIEVVLVMTHLACADEPEHPLNAEQVRRFDELRARLPAAPTSIGNSAGLLIDVAHRGDIVRPGIALYGGNPFRRRANPMARVVTLTAPILQIHDIDSERTVGYGATYVAKPPKRIATLGIGYADGYPRSLGNRGVAAVGGQRVPVIGRVSMDFVSIDLSDLSADAARTGDPVELIGPTVGPDEVAKAAGTISYELFTGLGRRLVRGYLGEKKA